MVYWWNMTIQYWMKKYVYMRIVGKEKNPAVWKFFLVFMISAFWHGFYPCYYIFFPMYGLYLFIIGEFKYVYSHKFGFIPKSIVPFLCWFFTWVLNSSFSASFRMYAFNDYVYHFSCINWWPQILFVAVFAFMVSPIGAGIKRSILKDLKDKKAASPKKEN